MSAADQKMKEAAKMPLHQLMLAKLFQELTSAFHVPPRRWSSVRRQRVTNAKNKQTDRQF